MYLKSFSVYNFRKFYAGNGENNDELKNTVKFVNSNAVRSKDNSEINVAAATTLIIGKNNSGKTTFVEALDKLSSDGNRFNATDYNFKYLQECLESCMAGEEQIVVPEMRFKIVIGLEEDSTDLVTNVIPFMQIKDAFDSDLEINIRYEIMETAQFQKDVNEMLGKYTESEPEVCFSKYLKLIEKAKRQLNYYNKDGNKVEEGFKLSDVLDFCPIIANRIKDERALSKIFSRIIKYQYENIIKDTSEIEKNFDNANKIIDESVKENHTNEVNNIIRTLVSLEHMQVSLKSDITLEKMLNSLIKYQYKENEYYIPENQFGLGYTNLMMVVAEILDYMEKYPSTEFNSKINLISIEEPETYMHPQMQELFIENINEVISKLLNGKDKHINSQIIITTHSSHIVNSKIQAGNSFECLNYIGEEKRMPCVIPLSDEIIKPTKTRDMTSENKEDEKENEQNFLVLKKYMKYKISEIFFAEAVILVEGTSEETLLPFYIEENPKLNKRYICIFNINGAYGHIYYNLLKTLKIPSLIITDLDVERENTKIVEIEGKDGKKYKVKNKIKIYPQLKTIEGQKTTNGTIKFFLGKDDISEIGSLTKIENIYIACQNEPINGYYATSFEEAFILENYDNDILNKVLKSLKPIVYKRIVKTDKNNNKKNSYMWQKKLSDDKSEFASKILYELLGEKEAKNRPKLPAYILNGLKELEIQLENKGAEHLEEKEENGTAN